jgi:GNAT superfamily N-acetyltransferase
MKGVEVRPIRVEDVSAVIQLVTSTLAEFGLTFGEGSNTDEELMQLPTSYTEHGGAFWVAVDANAHILGTCGVFPVGLPGDFELRKMYVRKGARGTGAGRQLLDESVTWARAHGGKRLVLDTTEKMERAIAFYERHGFVRDDAQIRGSRCSRGYTRVL